MAGVSDRQINKSESERGVCLVPEMALNQLGSVRGARKRLEQ